MLSPSPACLSDRRRLGLAHSAVRRSDSEVSADGLLCVSNQEVQRFTLQNQPLAAVIFTVIERVITSPAGNRIIPALHTVFHQVELSVMSDSMSLETLSGRL